MVDRWIRRRKKRRPAGTILAGNASMPIRDRSSLLVDDRLPNQDLVREVMSCSLVRSSLSCCSEESSSMPRKVRWLVLLTSPWRPACPVPGRLAAWWTWSPDRWASQADRAGGSHLGSAGGWLHSCAPGSSAGRWQSCQRCWGQSVRQRGGRSLRNICHASTFPTAPTQKPGLGPCGMLPAGPAK